MSTPHSFDARLAEVAARDGRYHVNAYRFVYEALDFTVRRIGQKRHVTGRELLEGIRDLALEQFGGLTLMVFDVWGVRTTGDFGNIVFNLVDAGLMSRSESDSREDFDDVYDFREVFRFDAGFRALRGSGKP
ncbi:MAG: Minf_1886 family protein [Planctomycetota bacterium]